MKCNHIIFDLDNTLYSSTAKIDMTIFENMVGFVADFFNISFDEAVKKRQDIQGHFGTTLEWLVSEGLQDVESFFARVHPSDEADGVPFDKNLRGLLESIDLPKSILTNAPLEHAERVLAKLNVADLFENITDIRECGLRGKPYPSAFKCALAKTGCAIENVLFLDDLRKYVQGYAALGGTAVLVGQNNGKPADDDFIKSLLAKAGLSGKKDSGQVLKIDSVYELPALLHKIRGL